MNNREKIQKLVGVSLLTALVVAFQLMSNYIQIGSISITLALVPLAVGAILYGPLVGLFLGLVMGGLIISAPSTIAVFFPVSVPLTVVLCLIKTGVAGLVAGFIFKGFAAVAKKEEDEKKKNILFAIGVILAVVLIPVINTGIFMIGAELFFLDVFGNFAGIVGAVITANFALEFGIAVVLSPAVVTVIKVLIKNSNLGFNKDFVSFTKAIEF